MMMNISNSVKKQPKELDPKFQRVIRNFNRLTEELNTIAQNPVIATRLYLLIKRIESLIKKYDLIILNCKVTKEVCNARIKRELVVQSRSQILPGDDLVYLDKMFDYLSVVEKVLLLFTYARSTAENLLKHAYELKDKHFTDEAGMIL